MAKRLLGRSARVWLFYLKHLQSQRGKLSFNIIREVCGYLADLLLPEVTSTFLRFFYAGAWGPEIPLRTPIQADKYSRWMMLEDARVFCSGGGNCQTGYPSGWSVAYLLSWDGAVKELPAMLAARWGHGVIQVLHIYIFGGCKIEEGSAIRADDFVLKQCEQIDINNHNPTWKALPDMKEGRSGFNPCLFNGFVYVCGQGSTLVEAFCPHTDMFLPLQVSIPESSSCCLCVHNNCLVVHSYSYVSKFTAGQASQLICLSQVKSQTPSSKRSNSQHGVDSTQGLHYIISSGQAYSINLETGIKLNLG